MGTDVDAENLDARLLRNTTGTRVAGLIYDALVQLDAALEPIPDLATSWQQIDATTWLLHLRADARFHDGVPVTAEDVVHTYETILDPELRSPTRTLYATIQRIESLDSTTVRFTLHEPYAPFLSYLDVGIVPKHLAASNHDLGSQPVGSGPYSLVRWDKGTRIILQANPNHWAGSPAIERIDIVLVPDNTARTQAFEAGDLDLIQSPMAPQDVQRLAVDGRFVQSVMPGPAITYLNFNTKREPLDSPDIRRAIAMLVDQRTIVEEIYENMDEPASSILLPASWAFTPDIQQPPYDPAGADSLLAALGWLDNDEDGHLDNGGRTLSIELGTHIEDANRVQTIEFLQNTFNAHGIQTTVQLTDWASFSAERDAGNFDLILLGWTQLVDPDRGTFEQLHSRGGLNWGRYANPVVDTALKSGRTAQGREERTVAYQEAAATIAHEVPYYVLSYQGYQIYHTPRLIGYEPDPRGRLRGLARARLVTPH